MTPDPDQQRDEALARLHDGDACSCPSYKAQVQAIADALRQARAEGRQEHPSIDDLTWLKDYAMGAASYSDQNTCVGRAEHAAAARDSDRAESIFDKLIAIAEGRQEQDK